jgi:pimeloyl-ACP methyl ester carboxylesterase
VAAATAITAGTAQAVREPGVAGRCRAGSTAATIGGKRTCLKLRQRCSRRYDRQYHRYGFHCHTGRLTRVSPVDPPPWTGERKVDVGGYALYVRCAGTKRPSVIVDNGRGQTSERWDAVLPLVSPAAHVCAYDRAGLGRSDPRPPSLYADNARMVDELRGLLRGLGLRPPYVLAAWSFGGINIHLYAHRYGAEVAGGVLVDAIWGPGGCRGIDHPLEPADCTAAGRELATAGPVFGSKPLVVLENGLATDVEWQQAQRNLATLSSQVVHVRADRSDHFGFLTVQADLTAEAIRRVAAAVSTGRPLSPCASTYPRLGATCLPR